MAIGKQMTADDAITVDISAADHVIKSGAIYVGVTGDVKITSVQGTVSVWVAFPAGAIIPCKVSRVWKVGTTASSMLALI